MALALLGAAAQAGAVSLEERLPVCLACHGEDGRSENAEVPSLGAQPASFVLIQLYQFREKQRLAEPMNEMAQDLTDDDLRTFSEAIAQLPPPPPAEEAPDAARMAKGQALAAKYRCGSCHDADFSGHDQMARLAGQREDYLAKALTGYKSGERTGYDPQMNEVAQDIAEPDIPELAYFLANWR
jgi:cytochrome c553